MTRPDENSYSPYLFSAAAAAGIVVGHHLGGPGGGPGTYGGHHSGNLPTTPNISPHEVPLQHQSSGAASGSTGVLNNTIFPLDFTYRLTEILLSCMKGFFNAYATHCFIYTSSFFVK